MLVFGAHFGSFPQSKQAGAGITSHAQKMLLLGAKSRAENRVLPYQQLQRKLITGKKLLPWSREAPSPKPLATLEGFWNQLERRQVRDHDPPCPALSCAWSLSSPAGGGTRPFPRCLCCGDTALCLCWEHRCQEGRGERMRGRGGGASL